MSAQVLLFSTDLVKWSADKMTATVSFNLYNGENVFSEQLDVNLSKPADIVEPLIKSLLDKTSKRLGSGDVALRDEEMIKTSLLTSFKKTQKELNSNKNGKGRNRQSITRYNLFYLKEPEIDLLSKQEKYYAYLDIIERKAAKEQFSQIGTYIQEAMQLNPDDKHLILYQAKFFLSVNKSEEALECYEKYTSFNEDNIQVLTDFARLCDKLNDTKKADKVYNAIIKLEPDNLDALARKAQLKYYKKQKYTVELDKIKKIDPNWLKDHIKKSWDFHLPDATQDLNPLTATEYLGLSKPIEVATLVMNKDIPAYYTPKEARMMFSSEELNQWFELVERFEMNDSNIDLSHKLK